MLVPLEGRLTWERSESRICFAIPGIHRWDMALLGLTFVYLTYGLLDGDASPDSIASYNLIVAGSLGCVGLGLFLFTVFSGSTILTFDEKRIKIVRRCLGINWRTRVFGTDSIGNLKYIPPRWRFIPRIRWIPSALSFSAGVEIHRFMLGIQEDEAEVLIQKFNEFQKPLEYIWGIPRKTH